MPENKTPPQAVALLTYSISKMRSHVSVEIFESRVMNIQKNSNQGENRVSKPIPGEDFEFILKNLESKDFQNLKDKYTDPKWNDGFSIRLSYKNRTILIENHEIPEALKKITDKIDFLISQAITL